MASTRLHEALTATSGVYVDAAMLIEARQSALQRIEVYDCPDFGRLMRIDGANMTSERDEFFYHENLIHPAAIAHPNPRQALIVGGGDGGAAEEILKHPVQRCQLCEIDADVIDMAKRHLGAIHNGVFDQPRLQLRIGDGAAYVRECENLFDLVYLDLTDPVGCATPLYEPSFFAACKRALADGGALVLHIGSPFAHAERVRTTLADLRAQFAIVTPYFVHIPCYGATWGFAVASDALDIRAVDTDTIQARLDTRGIGARQYYNGATHHAMLALPEYVKPLIT